jgi:2-phospho-L-lactate guanylyltransferase
MSASSPAPLHFAVLVPVKQTAVAKSRLAGLGDDARRELATAFAADTVAAALACPLVALVLVVTDDHLLADALRAQGAEVVPDGTSDLNGTLLQAAAEAQRRHQGLGVAAICADLPALRPDDLALALGAADPARMSFVADAQRVGTTMVVASDLATFRPSFGAGSRRRHLEAGAGEITGIEVPTLRRDVDDPAALADALRLGAGPHTSAVARAHRLFTGSGSAAMQGTVSAFDVSTRGGRVLLDDGVELRFEAGALEGSGLRLLRPGQRVRLETVVQEGTRRILAVQILTLH